MIARAARAVLLLVLAAGASPLHAQRDEVQVKAAFVLNFMRFTDWPAPPAPGEARVLAVLADRQFAGTVRDIAREAERLGQPPVKVRRLDPDAARERVREVLAGAHAVFVQAGEHEAHRDVLALAAGKPILTMGDAPGFARDGGMLGLVPSGARVGFDANAAAIHASGLTVSAKVLKLAQHVEPPG